MKIAIICKDKDILKDDLKSLIDSIYAGGTDVSLMCPSDNEEMVDKFLDYDYYPITYNDSQIQFIADTRTFFSLCSALRKDKPDLLLCVSARLCSVAALAARLTGVLEVYSVMSDLETIFRSRSKFRKGHARRLAKRVSRLSNKVIFHNTDSMLFFINNKLVKQKKATMVNGFGVDMQQYERSDYVFNGSFLMISKLSMDKGILEYAQAADIIKMLGKDVKFRLVGYKDVSPDALDLDIIMPHIKSGALEYFDGDGNDLKYIKDCSYFVYPSYNEGMPKFILEALSVGRPIITTDVSGCRDTVIEGYNGHLIEVQSVEKLVETIIGIIDDNSSAAKMAEAGYELCSSKFDRKLTNSRMLQILELNGEN